MRGGERAFVKVRMADGSILELEGYLYQYTDDLCGDTELVIRCPPRIALGGPRPRTGKAKKTKTKENNMDKYKVEIIRSRRTRSVTVHVQVLGQFGPNGEEMYLVAGGQATPRGECEEMPVYAKMSDEIFVPLRKAMRYASDEDDE